MRTYINIWIYAYVCIHIQRNIHNFGAVKNPRVVIHGESAGGYSVGALLTSPLAKGLFHGAIMESSYSAFRSRTHS